MIIMGITKRNIRLFTPSIISLRLQLLSSQQRSTPPNCVCPLHTTWGISETASLMHFQMVQSEQKL